MFWSENLSWLTRRAQRRLGARTIFSASSGRGRGFCCSREFGESLVVAVLEITKEMGMQEAAAGEVGRAHFCPR
jgi:hypothetical protein